jgi:high affinity sulfate transporter 1
MNTGERGGIGWRALTVVVPLAGQLVSYSLRQARGDVLAGLAAAAVLIPQSMAYGQVAGLTPTTGLYAALGAAVGYALFTSTRVVSVGPSSVMAIMTFTAVHDRAHGVAGPALALATGLALLAGVLCLTGAVLRLGNLAELLSQPVMLGYLAGSGLVIIASQANKLVGVTVQGRGTIVQVWQVLTHLNRAHPLTAILGAGCLVVLVLLRRFPALPGSLVVLLGAIAISATARLGERGVALVGAVSPGLPVPALPALNAADVWALLPAAAGVALVASAEIGRAAGGLGTYRGVRLNADRELAALGAANAVTGVLGGLPSAASYSRSTSARRTGATTQVFQLVTAGAVVVALLAGSPLAARLPLTALAAVAMTSAARLIDVGAFLQIWRGWRAEGVIALVAAIGVIGLGALQGLLLAVALAVWQLVRAAAHPHDAVLAYAGPDQPPREVADDDPAHPDVLIYRVDAPLFSANAHRIRDRVFALAAQRAPELRYVILDAEAVFYVDATAAETLARLAVELRAHSWQLFVARPREAVLHTLHSTPYEHGAAQHLPSFPTVRAAFDATQRPPP